MYRKILVPVDIEHSEKLGKAVDTAVDLAKHYSVPLCFVGVTTSAPGSVAHSPDEYRRKLQAYAREQGDGHGIAVEAMVQVAHDPAVDLTRTLVEAVAEAGADLVVMASHVPGLPEHLFASHAGSLAAHAPTSVFVVR